MPPGSAGCNPPCLPSAPFDGSPFTASASARALLPHASGSPTGAWALSALSLPHGGGRWRGVHCSCRAAGLLSLVLGAGRPGAGRAADTQGLRFWALGWMVVPWGGQKEVGNRQASGQDQPGRTLTFKGSQGEPDLGQPHIAIWKRGCWRNASQSESKHRTVSNPVLVRLFYK